MGLFNVAWCSVMKRAAWFLLALAPVFFPLPAPGRETVLVDPYFAPGEIIISQHARRLYFTLGYGAAVSYAITVPKRGKEWRGAARIDGKYVNPAWSPPVSVRRDHPELPDVIPGGSPHNPMGVRALTLDRDEIAIHGTNRPASIGTAASYGCIRMSNADVADLFERVRVGTRVMMVP